jgi:predicted MFS family arabinose efflux permease
MPRRGAAGSWRLAAATIAAAAFLTTIDNTIVNVALPSIQRDLHMSLPQLQWVVTGYLVMFAALMLPGGRLADRYGARRILLAGLAVFTAASLPAGLAPDAAVLLAARAVQGAGAALVLPAGLAVVASAATARQRDGGAAVWMAALAAALATGPVAGGWLTQHLGWHWVFLVNIPVGLAGLALGWRGLPDTGPGGGEPVRLATLAALARVGAFGGGLAASVLWGAGVNGVMFYTSLFLQRTAGFSASRTGLVFLPLAALVVLVAPVTPRLAARFGPARTVAVGLAGVAAGLAAVALVRHQVTMPRLLPGLALIGIGSALTVPMTSTALAAVPPARTGVASGLLAVAREASGLVGISALGLIVTAGHQVPAHGRLGGGFVGGYGAALLTAAGLVLAGAVIAGLTLPGPLAAVQQTAEPARAG